MAANRLPRHEPAADCCIHAKRCGNPTGCDKSRLPSASLYGLFRGVGRRGRDLRRFGSGLTGTSMLMRLFTGLAVAAGIFAPPPAAFAVVPDGENAAAKPTATAAAPASDPAAESPAADTPVA